MAADTSWCWRQRWSSGDAGGDVVPLSGCRSGDEGCGAAFQGWDTGSAGSERVRCPASGANHVQTTSEVVGVTRHKGTRFSRQR